MQSNILHEKLQTAKGDIPCKIWQIRKYTQYGRSKEPRFTKPDKLSFIFTDLLFAFNYSSVLNVH